MGNQADLLPAQNKSSLLPWLIRGFACLLILVGVVCGILASIYRSDSHVGGISTVCPGGHELTEFRTPNSHYYCNICGDSQRWGAHMFGCRVCDWDRCGKCASTP